MKVTEYHINPKDQRQAIEWARRVKKNNGLRKNLTSYLGQPPNLLRGECMFGFFKKKRPDEELMKRLVTAAAEGLQRSKIDAALGSLGIELEHEEDNSQYCIKTTAAFVKKVIEGYGGDISKANDDDIITAGVFLFTISNHITRVIGAPFESVSSITPLELFNDTKSIEELTEYIPIIINTYNDAAENTKIIDAIGQNFVKFLNEQQYSQFKKLIDLYGLCRKNIKET